MNIPSAPERVTLNITNQCNLNCLYCAVSSTKNAPGDMNLEEWQAVIDELARIKVFNLLISGGEPFLRQDFYELLKHIFKYHFRISINTNGTVLNDRVLPLVSESGRLDNIQVSLDGADPETHDAIRGRGSFKKIIGGIKSLCEWKIPFSFFVVVCKNNKNCLGKIVSMAKDLGALQVTFSTLLPQGSALAHLDDLFLSFDEQKKVESELRYLKKKNPRLVKGSLVQTIEMMDMIARVGSNKDKPITPNKITSCGGSVSECSIRPEGWIIPCDRLWDYKVGNVKEESFQSIWLNSEIFRRFRKRYSRNMDYFEECRGCPYSDICRGGCPAVPYYMGRGIDGWDPLSCFRVFSGEIKSYV
jgi:SynChlorMet cassette radical SAM/SPASM protein ScmE